MITFTFKTSSGTITIVPKNVTGVFYYEHELMVVIEGVTRDVPLKYRPENFPNGIVGLLDMYERLIKVLNDSSV